MSLTLVVGPMFAGKTSWILQQVNRAKSMSFRGIVVRPTIAARYEGECDHVISSHDQLQTECMAWPSSEPLIHLQVPTECKQVIVEEAQFTTGLTDFVKANLDRGLDLVLVGLNGDYLQRPFCDSLSGRAEFAECISQADEIVLLKSLCAICRDGTPALFTKRLSQDTSVVLVASDDIQQAVCRKHL